MGKTRFNKKSRQIVDTIIDNTETDKIQLDVEIKGQYDHNNMLVLPSKKRKTRIKHDHKQITRILSKKHRKHLEKIIEKKQKKENRASLLDALSQVQATPDELKQLTSISMIQTKGLKRYIQEEMRSDLPKKIKQNDNNTDDKVVELNSLRGAKRRHLIQKITASPPVNNPNIVGFETDSDSDTEPETIKAEVVATTPQQTIPPNQERQSARKPPVERKPAIFVDVLRDETVQAARLKLPILNEEQSIMETINHNHIVLICGETGCGKTTQIPQFLYEAGYCLNQRRIAVTEPRRIAAITMSKRVAYEMNLTTKEISYLIRFEGNINDQTKIQFMTDGVLLKEIQQDLLLQQYSVIILDEVHERSINTDILIGFLTRIVQLRLKRNDPLKLILMSATIRLEDFVDNQRLFKRNPPVIEVNTRQYPVTIHFNKRTNADYLQETYKKTVKIHTKLPDGGILVFLTGQLEVNRLVRKLRKSFPYNKHKTLKKKAPIPEIDLDDYAIPDADLDGASSEDDDRIVVNSRQPLWVLPLYSLLPTDKQNEVFQPPPPGCRLCIVSTNVAETSLTIPNIKYVVDCGKTKQKLYDHTTGVCSFVVTWTSKASADQRAGRAGRTQSGHCYRLYSSAVYNNDLPSFLQPEITQKPIDDLYLQMKSMNINKIINFPFVTTPDLLQLKASEKRLEILGALIGGDITALGRIIVKFPVLPRYGKMLALSHQYNLLPYTICLIAALSVQELLLERPIDGAITGASDDIRRKWLLKRRQAIGGGESTLFGDFMVLLWAIGGAEFANSNNHLTHFCHEYGLREKAVLEVRKLRLQLTNIVNCLMPGVDVIVDPQLPRASDLEIKLLRQILLSGYGDQIARKIPPDELKHTQLKHAYHANDLQDPVYIANQSIVKKQLPEFVIYQDLYESNGKLFMRNLCVIEPEWLPIYVPALCNLSEPRQDPPPFYHQSDGRVYCYVCGTFGRQAWQLPIIKLQYPNNQQCCKWFGKFLLDGQIYKQLEKFARLLTQPSSILLKTWSKLNPKCERIVKCLIENRVFTKHDLDELWMKDAKFLLREYQEWLPDDAKYEVETLWPPKY